MNRITVLLCCIAGLSFFHSCHRGPDRAKQMGDPVSALSSDTLFIPADSANRMTSSYLISVGAASHDTLQYWTIEADALKAYLADTGIRTMKVALAHTLQYINEGHYGVAAGFSPQALTLVITGLDENGNTVFYSNGRVLDHTRPCPPFCPTTTE